MFDVFPKCNEEVSDSDSELTCFGDASSGVSEATSKSKGSSLRKTWQFPTCKVVKSLGGGPGAKEKNQLNIAVMFASVNAKLGSLISRKETVSGLEKSLQEMLDKYDEVLKDLAERKKETKHLNQESRNSGRN
ncbi:uncharacterized protein ISCGN_001171 [Ixodes scapularis]